HEGPQRQPRPRDALPRRRRRGGPQRLERQLMSTTALRSSPFALRAFGAVGFAAAVAAASQIAIPLPFTPVPITLQPMLVILAGMMLGPAAGAASMALYLAAGALGLPVF